MCKITLWLVSLALTVCALREQAPIQHDEADGRINALHDHVEHRVHLLKVLASFLLTFDGTAGFNPSALLSNPSALRLMAATVGHQGAHGPFTARKCHHISPAVRMDGTGDPQVSVDRERNGLITIAPPNGTLHTASFIGPIHGLGDTNMGWADVAMQFHYSMPHVKFLLPNAPVSPVTLNGGMSMPSWYDITSLDDSAGQPCDGIEESRSRIIELIEEEVRSGIPLDRIVVGGFSQGGAMSLYTGLQYPGKLAGVLCMSGYLAKAEAFKLSTEAASTPVAHFHGIADPTVRLEWARESANILLKLGHVDYTLKEYEGLGHGAATEEIDDILKWLKERLP